MLTMFFLALQYDYYKGEEPLYSLSSIMSKNLLSLKVKKLESFGGGIPLQLVLTLFLCPL